MYLQHVGGYCPPDIHGPGLGMVTPTGAQLILSPALPSDEAWKLLGRVEKATRLGRNADRRARQAPKIPMPSRRAAARRVWAAAERGEVR